MRETYVLLAEDFEEVEALTVVDDMRRGGLPVKTVALADDTRVRGAHDIYVEADLTLRDLVGEGDAAKDPEALKDKAESWECIVLPGGLPGSEYLRDDDRVIAMLQAQDRRGGLIAAICAAPLALDRAGLLEGRRHTSFPGIREKLSQDATYVDDQIVVRDDNLLTARGPATAVYFALALIGIIGGDDKKRKVGKGLLIDLVEDAVRGTEEDE